MLGFEAMARAVRDMGISTMFGVMGDGNLHFIDAFVHLAGGRYVAARHEAGAVCMADGAARVLGRRGLGVATVTHGPGLTNAMTALTAASRNRTPLLLIAGDLPRGAVRHSQRIDQAAVVMPTGAGYVRATTTNGAERQVEAALRQALLERRPVVLDVANDVQREAWASPVAAERVVATAEDVRAQRMAADADALDTVARVIDGAARPVILAGRGALWSGAKDDLEALADRCGALLATTLLAKDMFRGNPHNLGVVGVFGHEPYRSLFADSDCVIAFGARLHSWTTGQGSVFPNATIVHIDSDPAAIDDYTAVDHAIIGDAQLVAAALSHRVKQRGNDEGFRTEGVRALIEGSQGPHDAEYTLGEDSAAKTRLTTPAALRALDTVIPGQRMVFSDGGHFFSYPGQCLAVQEPESFVLAANFGAIGLGLATGIGGAMARPSHLCVVVIGDGGLMMSLPELETAVRYKVPMVVLVVNDAAYGTEVHALRAAGRPADTAQFPETSFTRVAEGLGARGLTMRSEEDAVSVGALLENLDGPLVVDIKVNGDVVAPWFVAAKLPSGAPTATRRRA